MKFEPRLKAPAYNDKHWMHTSKGGYNSCILIKGIISTSKLRRIRMGEEYMNY